MSLAQAMAGNIAETVAAVGALGTAAYGLVDGSKAMWGGVSNAGFGGIREAIRPFEAALEVVSPGDPYVTLKANWLNGMGKDDQKAAAKSLIRLGLNSTTAPILAQASSQTAPAALAAVSAKIAEGTALTPDDLDVLGRFDAVVSAHLDAGYERADQFYRSSARALAGGLAIALALIAGWQVAAMTQPSAAATDAYGFGSFVTSGDFLTALLIGIIAVPLSPVAKDLASALSTAVSAFRAKI